MRTKPATPTPSKCGMTKERWSAGYSASPSARSISANHNSPPWSTPRRSPRSRYTSILPPGVIACATGSWWRRISQAWDSGRWAEISSARCSNGISTSPDMSASGKSIRRSTLPPIPRHRICRPNLRRRR